MYKAVVFVALVAAANAGFIGAPVAAPLAYSSYAAPALVSQQNNILRTPGNLGQVSTYSKTISTPYSSVSKSDVRVSNDALAYAAAPAIAAPVSYAAAPAIAAPVSYAAAPAIAAPLSYAAAPAVAAPVSYAPTAYAAPLGAPLAASGVVSHISFDGIGAHYAY